MTFSAVDIIIVGFILIFGIIGMKKGFVNQIGKFMIMLISICVGVWLCGKVAGYVYGFSFMPTLESSIYTWLNGTDPLFNEYIDVVGEEGFYQCLTALKIPEFIQGTIVKLLNIDFSALEHITVVSYLTPKLVQYIAYGLAFLIVFIGAWIALRIALTIVDKFFKATGLGLLDKLLGLVFGAGKFVLFIWVVFYGISFLTAVPKVAEYVNNIMNNYVLTSTVGKLLYENNILINLIDKFL